MIELDTQDLEVELRHARRKAYNAERRVVNAEEDLKRAQKVAKSWSDSVAKLEGKLQQRREAEVNGL